MMRTAAVLAFGLLLDAATAQAAANDATIVVTARSSKQTAADLAACLARKCPPDEDVRLSLAHAENQFVSGAYKDARSTLLSSIGRNRRFGKTYPVPVSDLLRANSRVAAHLGESESYQSSIIASRDTLRSGVGVDDPRTLVGTIEVGDMRARLGFPDEADRIYRSVADRAAALNLPYLASSAQLRAAWLKLESENQDEQRIGRERLTAIAASTDPKSSSARLAARVLLARIGRKKGDDSGTKALIAEYAASGGAAQPVLLAGEPIKQPEVSYRPEDSRNVLSQLATKNFDGQWFDVGFWVAPDGHPTDIEIIRRRGAEEGWIKPVLTSIATRVYAPLKRDPGDPGAYIVERYTLTSFWEDRLGTRIRQRSAIPRIERMDLTPEQIAASDPA